MVRGGEYRRKLSRCEADGHRRRSASAEAAPLMASLSLLPDHLRGPSPFAITLAAHDALGIRRGDYEAAEYPADHRAKKMPAEGHDDADDRHEPKRLHLPDPGRKMRRDGWQRGLQHGVRADAGPADPNRREDTRRAQPRARHLTESDPQLETVCGGGINDRRPGDPRRDPGQPFCGRRTPRSWSSSGCWVKRLGDLQHTGAERGSVAPRLLP